MVCAVSLSYDILAEAYDGLYGGEQAIKYRLVLQLVPPVEPALDAGCGTGLLLQLLNCYFVGLDLSTGMLRIAKKRALRGDLVRADAERLPFRDHCFRTVYSVTVAHEAPRLAEEVKRVLKPAGYAAITLLKKRIELLPRLASSLPGARVYDAEALKDVIVVYRASTLS